jgi:hypothetical protein
LNEEVQPDKGDPGHIVELQLVRDWLGHLFGGQRSRAEPLYPVPVDVQAEILQFREQLVVAQGVGRRPQRPAVAHELESDTVLVDPFLADPVESDPRHVHAFLR